MTQSKRLLSTTLLGLLLFSGMLLAPFAHAAQWYQQFSVASTPFYDVHATTETVVTVGQNGYIAYSSDGQNWEAASSSTTKHLYAVVAATSTNLYAAGFNGTILRTVDSGATWSSTASSTSSDLWAIAFVGKQTGIAAGESGTIVKTTDGLNFSPVTSGTANDLFAAYAPDASTVYVVGKNGTILKSIDKGSHWTTQSSGISKDLYAVWCSSATHCVAVGELGAAVQTTDGSTWTPLSADLSGENGLSVDGYDSEHFSIGAGNSHLHTTTDGGTSFTTNNMAEGTPSFNGMHYRDADTWYVVGEGPGGEGAIWRNDSAAPSTPANFRISEGTPTNNNTPTFEWDAATDDGSGVTGYVLDIDNGDVRISTTLTNVTLTSSLEDGVHSATLYAYDSAENVSNTELSFTIDTVDPTVGTVSPIAAYTAETTTLQVSAGDSTSGIASCELAINGFTVGSMSHVSGDTWKLDYEFSVPGSYTAFAACLDAADNAKAGSVVNVTVALGPNPNPEPEPEVTEEASMSSLISLACPGGEDATHPCRAVYWYGTDGMRHAFPNDKAYFTWFSNFDDVITVSEDFMASIPLGSNVTYKPGSRMVKFPSVNTVYAVGLAGELRAIDSEAVATDLYGSAWNTLIDDINIAFYFNYSYGADILNASDYDIAAAQAAMTSPDDLF